MYPEELKSYKKLQDKKMQDKRQNKFNKILEICKEAKSVQEIIEQLGYKSAPTLKRDYINH